MSESTVDRLLKLLGVRRAGENGAQALAQDGHKTLFDQMLSDQQQSRARSKAFEGPFPITVIDIDG